MTVNEFEQIKQANDHLVELKRFEAFLSSHNNLVLDGDNRSSQLTESAKVPAVVSAEWLASVRALLSIAQTRFNKISVDNING
jgi:hypothetical protein